MVNLKCVTYNVFLIALSLTVLPWYWFIHVFGDDRIEQRKNKTKQKKTKQKKRKEKKTKQNKTKRLNELVYHTAIHYYLNV